MKSVLEQLKSYVKNPPHPSNIWLHDDTFEVYVRKGHRLYCGKMVTTLDLANFQVIEPKDRGKGLFSTLFEELKKLLPWDGIYIEAVLNERLVGWCRRKGGEQAHGHEPPSFFFMNNQDKSDAIAWKNKKLEEALGSEKGRQKLSEAMTDLIKHRRGDKT